MASQQFEWTQPIGGKKIAWRTLKVGDLVDIEANYSASNMTHLKRLVTIAARIVSIDGVDKSALKSDDTQLLRDWEDYDLNAFVDEFNSRELAREVALAPQRPGGVVTALEQAVSAAQTALNDAAFKIMAVVQKAKEAEQKLGPLGK